MKSQIKLIRIATVAMSLDMLLKGQLKFLNKYFKVVAISGNDNYLKNVQKREGVSTLSVNMSRKIQLLKDFKSLIMLYKSFIKERPTVVHSITPKAGLLSMMAAYFARVPIRMHTFTGLIFPNKTGIFKTLLIVIDRLTCRFATHIYPEGNGVKQDLVNFKITKKPLKIIANGNINGINLEFFNPDLFLDKEKQLLKKQLQIPSANFVFVFVGRLVKDKGLNELVEAFLLLQEKTKNSTLLLVGTFEKDLDPLKEKTSIKIRDHKNIKAVGFQNDIRLYLAISNALVFPSYREGFPNVVLQAGAMNLPAIVTDINGSNEIIKENINGTIIKTKNTEAIYQAMKKMIENEAWRLNLKKNTRRMIAERYEQKYVWNSLLKEYNLLLKDV